MGTETGTTEEKILHAAEEIFQEKGFDGTRMQEVADHAGINKGLLHYYFKTKDALFEAIFSVALGKMIAKITGVLEVEQPLEEKIGVVVDQYMALLLRNPGLPRFVLHELNKNPDKFVQKHITADVRRAFQRFTDTVQGDVNSGTIKAIDPRQLFTNMMSLLIFPFVGRPMLQTVTASDNEGFKELLAARREHIKLFIMDAIRV